MTDMTLPVEISPRALQRWAAGGLLAALLTACGGGGGSTSGGNTGGPVNTAPKAVITQTSIAGIGQSLSFDGSKSSDAEGDSLRYTWMLRSAPTGSKAALDAANSVTASFVPDRGGVYEVTLVVNDGKVDSTLATRSINVTSRNRPPVAHYSFNVPMIPGEGMEIDANGSHDADGDALTFKLTVLSTPQGAVASFSDATSAKPALVAQQAGEYQLRLEVSDGEATDSRTLTVIVDNRPIAHIASVPPAVPGREVVLDASASTDPDGDPLTYAWRLVTLPPGSRAVLSSASGSKVRFTPDAGGIYAADLVVYDKYTSTRSTKLAFVIANHPPVAQITAPASARPNSTVQLDAGKSSDAEMSPLTYAWRMVSQPAGSLARLDGSAARQPKFRADLAGTYVVSLVVNDGTSDSESVSASISVAAAGDVPHSTGVTMTPQPALPGQDIQFAVSATDPRGLPLSYQWQFSDGTTANGPSVTRRFASAGSYDVSVVASNSQGQSGDATRVTARVVGQVISSLTPACTGANCGAAGLNRYSGSGTGIWAHANGSGDDQALNLDIDNVAPGHSVMLLISNGGPRAAASLPDFGQAPAAGASANASLRRAQTAAAATRRAAPNPLQARHDEAHSRLHQRNEALLKAYAKSTAPLRKALGARALAAGRAVAPPRAAQPQDVARQLRRTRLRNERRGHLHAARRSQRRVLGEHPRAGQRAGQRRDGH